MTEENLTPATLPGEPDISSAGGAEAASDVASVKDTLGKTLGKTFESDEAALKAVKDTFDHVGRQDEGLAVMKELETSTGDREKAMEAIRGLINPDAATTDKATGDYISRSELAEMRFYDTNTGYAPYRDIINARAASSGKSHAEVVEEESFKSLYDSKQASDESDSSKSVLMSNSRLGKATDKISEARLEAVEARKTDLSGDPTLAAKQQADADRKAVGAVLDTLNLDK